MRVNCLGCGYRLDLDDAYDDYEGPVKCFACRATLEIRTEQGSIRAIKQVYIAQHPSAGEGLRARSQAERTRRLWRLA